MRESGAKAGHAAVICVSRTQGTSHGTTQASVPAPLAGVRLARPVMCSGGGPLGSRGGHEAGPIAHLDDEPLIDHLAKLSRGGVVNLPCISTMVLQIADGLVRRVARSNRCQAGPPSLAGMREPRGIAMSRASGISSVRSWCVGPRSGGQTPLSTGDALLLAIHRCVVIASRPTSALVQMRGSASNSAPTEWIEDGHESADAGDPDQQ